MSVAEIVRQIADLNVEDLAYLADELQAILAVRRQQAPESAVSHPQTGAEIVAALEAMEPIELVDPHIEDPVEWVKAQRLKEANRLKPYWDGDL